MFFPAYIDAGTGSMLMQIAIAAVVSGLLFFGKIKCAIAKLFLPATKSKGGPKSV